VEKKSIIVRQKVQEDAAADFRLSYLAHGDRFVYLVREYCDIYCRKKAFQRFEGMAEAQRWRLQLRPG